MLLFPHAVNLLEEETRPLVVIPLCVCKMFHFVPTALVHVCTKVA